MDTLLSCLPVCLETGSAPRASLGSSQCPARGCLQGFQPGRLPARARSRLLAGGSTGKVPRGHWTPILTTTPFEDREKEAQGCPGHAGRTRCVWLQKPRPSPPGPTAEPAGVTAPRERPPVGASPRQPQGNKSCHRPQEGQQYVACAHCPAAWVLRARFPGAGAAQLGRLLCRHGSKLQPRYQTQLCPQLCDLGRSVTSLHPPHSCCHPRGKHLLRQL